MDAQKEKILKAAEELIQAGDGAAERLTVRAIAEKAGVGVGLINYHFQTKENLIELCVQRIIGRVVSGFRPVHEAASGRERVKAAAKEVFRFLLENPAVSRISILGDLKSPGTQDNTMGTVEGFLRLLGDASPRARAQVFAFTATLQEAFLRRDITSACLGYDVRIPEERDALSGLLADTLLETGKEGAEWTASLEKRAPR